MHEFAIAEELLATVDKTLEANGGTAAVKVIVEIGPGVTPEPLRSAFDALKVKTAASRAELDLQPISQEAFCIGCGTRSVLSPSSSTGETGSDSPSSGEFACPECGGTAALWDRTPEVTLKSIELEV